MVNNANNLILQIWLKDVVFSWQWWIQLLLTILPWIVWILIRKKNSTHRLLHTGLFVMIISLTLDMIGVSFGLWRYKWELLPIIPSFIPWNFSLIPVAIMITIQFNPFGSNRYTKALLFSFLASFVVEPIFVKIGFYVPITWKYIYSFPIVVLIYLLADYLSNRTTYSDL